MSALIDANHMLGEEFEDLLKKEIRVPAYHSRGQLTGRGPVISEKRSRNDD